MNIYLRIRQLKNIVFCSLTILAVLLMSSCGGGVSDKVTTDTPGNKPPDNIAPTVDAGANQSVNENSSVTLTASASDSDGNITTYSWRQTSGINVTLSAADTATANFIAPDLTNNQSPISLTFVVTVTDNDGATAEDAVTINVSALPQNSVPQVDAGNDLSVPENTTVALTASANDSDGTITLYSWQQISGTPINFTGNNSPNINFTTPILSGGVTELTLSFSITVTDDAGATATDTVTVIVTANSTNIVPTVNAGSDKTVNENSNVILDASASDSDGSIVSYQWNQLSGNTISLTDANNSQSSFTAPSLQDPNIDESYSFEVVVTDDKGATASDTVTITVTKVVVVAGCTLTISPGDSFVNSFSNLNPGDTLCLNDGIYQQAMDIPSDIHVKAVNDGAAEIDGGGTLGVAWSGALLQLHGSNSSVKGLKVHHAGENSDTCSVKGNNNTFTAMSCSHGGFHKHKIPMKISGSGNLVQDSWFYGEGRYVVQCFAGTNNTIRRNVARWDSTAPNESSEPNAAFSIYACSEMTIENNISLDYGTPVTAMRYGGDFYEPAHSGIGFVPDNNYWLGNIAVNHASDTDNNRAMRFDPDMATSGNVVKDFYVRDVGRGFVISPKMTNLVIGNCTMINTEVGTTTTTSGVNIDCGAGADISKRYIDRSKTQEALFPWPNQQRIKADMCASGERQSFWCTTSKSLTDYILNQ